MIVETRFGIVKQVIISILFMMIPYILYAPTTDATETLEYKLFIVSSYSPNNFCSNPQLYGFLDGLKLIELNSHYKFKLQMVYLNSRQLSLESVQQHAKEVCRMISLYQPTAVITIDDIAFEYVGIPMSKNIPVFATGINRRYDVYLRIYKDVIDPNNVYIIREVIDLTKFIRFVTDLSLNLTDVYLLRKPAEGLTKTERYVLESVRTQLLFANFRVHEIEVRNMKELKDSLDKLMNKQTGIVVPLLLSLENYSVKDILYTVNMMNTKHLILCQNGMFCTLGCNICCSMSFYESGKQLATLLFKFLERINIQHLYTPQMQLTVNYNDLRSLGYSSIVDKISYIDKYVVQ